MAAGSTYTPIATTTLSSAAASVTFSSIPQGYTDLVLITSTASDISSDTNHILCQFNPDSSSNYSSTFLYGTGSSAASGRASNASGCFIGRHNPTEYGTGITHIQNYSNTTTYKSVLSRGGVASSLLIAYVNTWRNTSAITSMTLTPVSASTFDAGSTFTLYGITAA